ncbi:HelD family protein [Blautia argi]|uniref:HelD family protein n=2 Tax=Blautia TaxID=572511 RepID=UPI0029420164|nr:ATP-binding domain-containing protein [Blautia argi]
MKKNQDMLSERQHLLSCLEIIQKNIREYEEKEKASKKEVTQLFQAVKKGEGDSFGLLEAEKNILEHIQNSLRKNRAALKKAYFGRIDYEDKSYGVTESRYIGKNGVTRNSNEVVIVDWRAPVSSVYYENELGEGSYEVPGSEPVEISLFKKRTYDLQGEKLQGFYDNDTAANDDLLVKYLSQHKEAVLGDIIATIQKEQNEIIRTTPYKNMIVQGVAGSGKTTVALHRISYILYNYGEVYKPSEFCIIGSSDMLLNYISSGLPELDVNHVRQIRMDMFLPYLLEKSWKKKYKIVEENQEAQEKSKLEFISALEDFLKTWTDRALQLRDIQDKDLGLILSEDNMQDTKMRNPELSLFQLEKLFHQRIRKRIQFLCTEREESFCREKLQEYKNWFCSSKNKWTEAGVYLSFLEERKVRGNSYEDTIIRVEKGEFDLYDAAALCLIRKRIFLKKETDEFSQIILDEAQDFGESVYYVLKQVLPKCYFTIMGDVSQNIRYETGLNNWEILKKILLREGKDSFYLLAKSYRNTIEISEHAGRVLEKASLGGYKIQPVIRHGNPVCVKMGQKEHLEEELKTLLGNIQKKFETIAVICRDEKDTEEVQKILGIEKQEGFCNGIMVLPVAITKGLEFDAVVLWQPDKERYGENIKEAKLLYVAITRALHELYLLGEHELTGLLNEKIK